MIHLDTNFLVDVLVPGSPEATRLAAWQAAGETVQMSVMAWGEYLCGPLASGEEQAAQRVIRAVEPLLREDAELAARLFNLTGRHSRSFADCLIAAVAIRNGARLATSNTTDFAPFEPHGLVLA